MNNYSIFYLFMLNSAKYMSKLLKKEHECPKMATIWHYLAVFDFQPDICFLYKTKRLAYFDPIQVPNNETNTKYF